MFFRLEILEITKSALITYIRTLLVDQAGEVADGWVDGIIYSYIYVGLCEMYANFFRTKHTVYVYLSCK